MAVTIFTEASMREHRPPEGHPERPERLDALLGALERTRCERRAARPAPEEALRRVHTEAHVDTVLSLRGRSGQLDPDTFVSPGSADAALLSAGAAIDAVEHALKGRTGFALGRPPGHHAEPDRVMGFCLFSNVAIAAAHALARADIERVLILDWDVHHGNGTQRVFESRVDALPISIHQWPLWPGTGRVEEIGAGAGRGCTVNLPTPPGSTGADYALALERLVNPIARAFAPSLIIVSAGYDAHRRDPIGSMLLDDADYGLFGAHAQALADELCEGRLALALEGGYDLEALTGGVRATLAGLEGAPFAPTGAPTKDAQRSIERAIRVHADRWGLSV